MKAKKLQERLKEFWDKEKYGLILLAIGIVSIIFFVLILLG
jgi:hypothetical protein